VSEGKVVVFPGDIAHEWVGATAGLQANFFDGPDLDDAELTAYVRTAGPPGVIDIVIEVNGRERVILEAVRSPVARGLARLFTEAADQADRAAEGVVEAAPSPAGTEDDELAAYRRRNGG
jgi:hypothetical protein